MRNRTYIAFEFDHDENAFLHLKKMNEQGFLSFSDAHELQQSNDSSLPCSIKSSLKYRMDNSYKFVLIVGNHTDTVSKGGCQLCSSYNASGKYCKRGYAVDYRSFIKFECEKAVKDGLQIVVLYNGITVDKSLCPEIVRWKGTHQAMVCRGNDGDYYWNDMAIIRAFG